MSTRELADTFCFSGFSTMVLALWFVYGSKHIILYILINFMLVSVLWFILRSFCIPSATHIDMFFYSLQYFYMIANLHFARLFFVLGGVFVIIGVAGVFVVIPFFWLKKLYGENCRTSLDSNRKLMVIIQMLCIIFVNGYRILCFWYLNVASHDSQRLGIVLLGVLGGLTSICCI